MFKRSLLLASMTIVIPLACAKSQATAPPPEVDAGACTSPEFAGAPLGVRCNALVDGEGRTVLLHGVNARVNGVFDVTFDDGRLALEPIPTFTSEDAARIRALGFNALRLPVQWSAIEPTETGGFDEAYLDKVAAVTQTCAAAALYVLIDFHQDAYSKEIGEDGAPLWAIVPAPSQPLGGPLGNDLGTRRGSQQVGAAFATFFGSSADGARLRDRFARMGAHVAARFASDPAVVGFELYNEPLASDVDIHVLYDAMIPLVRAAAPTKLIFFEPSVIRNQLDQAPPGKGNIGAGTVYAPHVYTYSFTDTSGTFTQQQLEPSNLAARDEADSWGAPLAVTEYGFDPSKASFASYVLWQQHAQDTARASSFLWLWKEPSQGGWGFYDYASDGAASERASVVLAMTRARLEAVAGELATLDYDDGAQRLVVTFNGIASSRTNQASLGAGMTPPAAAWVATCDGASVATSGTDPLRVECGGVGGHTLVLSAH